MSIDEAREKLSNLANQWAKQHDNNVVIVTRHNRPVLAIMPWELYDALIETLGIAGVPELRAQLRKGIREVATGETESWENVFKV